MATDVFDEAAVKLVDVTVLNVTVAFRVSEVPTPKVPVEQVIVVPVEQVTPGVLDVTVTVNGLTTVICWLTETVNIAATTKVPRIATIPRSMRTLDRRRRFQPRLGMNLPLD